MHEVTIMQEALRMALEAARKEDARRILTMRLSIGKWSCAEPQALRFAFEAITKDTPAEGADLVIETPEPLLRCRECGTEYPAESMIAPCPDCGRSGARAIRGREAYIVSVEVE